jgi:hypothetical protein
LRAEMSAFWRRNAPFVPKTLARTTGKAAPGFPFSFHEMSDFNALQRAFIKARTASGNGG